MNTLQTSISFRMYSVINNRYISQSYFFFADWISATINLPAHLRSRSALALQQQLISIFKYQWRVYFF